MNTREPQVGSETSPARVFKSRYLRRIGAVVLFAALLSAAFATQALATKQLVDYFGTPDGIGTLGGQFSIPNGIAINQTGAGPADAGDIYVTDGGFFGQPTNRVQRIGRDDHGTPSDLSDDSYFFRSVWGADVDTPAAGSDYEICTIAAQCKAAVGSGGSGTVAGNGVFNFLDGNSGVAVDQDTGDVYVSDTSNHRVSVYDGTGVFLRSFGWDVVASGPDDSGTGYEVCLAANGDVCKAGTAGSDAGQISSGKGIAVSPPDGNDSSGTVFLADAGNSRVAVFGLDGTSLGSFGSAAQFTKSPNGSEPISIAVDSRGIVYASSGADNSEIERYDTENANGGGVGFLSPISPTGVDERQRLRVAATAGTYKLNFEGESTQDIPFDWPGERFETPAVDSVGEALRELPAFGRSGVIMDGSSGGPGDAGGTQEYPIHFFAGRGATNQPQITTSPGSIPLSGGGAGVKTTTGGNPSTDEVQAVFVNATGGEFVLSLGGESTAGLPFDSSAATVKSALEAVAGIGTGNVSVAGGPGDATASSPYQVTFIGALGHQDVPHLSATNGSPALSGGSHATVITQTEGASGLSDDVNVTTNGLAVDPDSDGPGPEEDVLYVFRVGTVQQFGPANAPGLTLPPTTYDDQHVTRHAVQKGGGGAGLAIEEGTGRLYMTSSQGGGQNASGLYIAADGAGGPPSTSLDSLSDVTQNSVTAHATIDPNGPPITRYRFEYSTDGSDWTSLPTVDLGTQASPQPIETVISPPGGFDPGTSYHLRLVASKLFSPTVTSNGLTFTTEPSSPQVETSGTAIRTTSAAQFAGRVNPRNAAATFHFEYGSQGPCDSSPCASTPDQSAGAGNLSKLVAADVGGLSPNTTYHYRVVADSSNAGSPVFGADRTLTTRASDAPLSHGEFPGPPGSDRAYEQVTARDIGGNASESVILSDNGTRAVYGITGGTPTSSTGGFNQFLSERTPQGWRTLDAYPKRSDLPATNWSGAIGARDLSQFFAINASQSGTSEASAFRISPSGPPVKLHTQPTAADYQAGTYRTASDDGSAMVVRMTTSPDPLHPTPLAQLYELATGTPRMVSLMPGEVVPSCNIPGGSSGNVRLGWLPPGEGSQTTHQVSANGRYVFFAQYAGSCSSATQLFVRDLDLAETTRVSPPPLSGPICESGLIKSTPGAVFFWTQSRLTADDDDALSDCTGSGDQGGDVYRYDLASHDLICVTCAVPTANVLASSDAPAASQVSVSEDGSRLYFISSSRLLAGARARGLYRMMVDDGDLAYVGYANPRAEGNPNAALAAGDDRGGTITLNPDGTVVYFYSAEPELNPIGGADNGGTLQLYRYGDVDRSLVCVSCPTDGVPAARPLEFGSGTQGSYAANNKIVSDAGDSAFVTTLPLLSRDQNTPDPGGNPALGTDIYEWRDGRLLLITDGITRWKTAGREGQPALQGITPSGSDVFFRASTPLTPDAPDSFPRAYTAKIGGGFDFPANLPPCDLNAGSCEGPGVSPSEQPGAGSAVFSGPGNPKVKWQKPSSCRKGKVKRKGRCVAKKPHKANHHRRTHR
jgi:hypothetical protein